LLLEILDVIFVALLKMVEKMKRNVKYVTDVNKHTAKLFYIYG